MQPVEFAVWTILAVFTLFFFISYLLEKRNYRNALLFDRSLRIAHRGAPWLVSTWAAVLLVFLFIDLNKFYLLVIFPLVYLLVKRQVAKKLTEEE